MKYENEITVEVSISISELINLLTKQKFKLVEVYDVIDTYMVNNNYINYNDPLILLSNSILIRNVITNTKSKKIITYKYKEYNDKLEIIKQGKLDCNIIDLTEAINLFKKINYQELINVSDHVSVYTNGIDEIAIEEVNNKHIYIEIEEKCNNINKTYSSIEEMKEVIKKYHIPIKTEDYYVKKALIELEETRNKKYDNQEYLNKTITIKIDRPFGSKHPKHNFIYPVNYGYIENTLAPDGEELDCYLLGIFEPVKTYTGKCIAIIHRTNDNDDKLIIVPKDKNYSNEQIEALTEFQEKYFNHIIIR